MNLYKDLIGDDDDFEMDKNKRDDDILKFDFKSKRIKKMQNSSRGSKSSFNDLDMMDQRLKGVNEKVKDMGEYWLIHKLNPITKRLNQMLMCKSCPLKFPKLCNLRDHLRIHKDQMPFKCKYCGKAFTQAGNRDRHEKKKVCQKKNHRANIGAEYRESETNNEEEEYSGEQ